jgi:hypothetical protein
MDLNKFSSKAQGLLGKMSEVTQELSEKAEQRAAERKEQKEKEQAIKEEVLRLEAEEATGYYMRDGKLIISTIDGMKTWLTSLGQDTTPALMQTLQMQLQVLKQVQSPSMTGMALDNMMLCMSKAVNTATNDSELANIREAVASMIQNYFFMQEANLKCAQLKNKKEGYKLLTQSGEMLSNAVIKTASALTGGTIDMATTVVRNIFEAEAVQQGYIKNLIAWIGDKKQLKEKEKEFNQTLEMLFETFDLHATLIGPSILIKGMLSRYRKTILEHRENEKLQMYINRGYKIDVTKLSKITSDLQSTATAIVRKNPINALSGITTVLGGVAGLVVDKINSNNKTELDIKAYCTLQDALEVECNKLQEELSKMEGEITSLKQQHKELGMLQFAEKKELQQKIDLKVEEKDAVYNALKTTKEKLAEMKQLFPDAYAIKVELDQLEEKLMAVENKFL